ncbi:S1C family serine protease, partial [Enterobacter cloacae complex sp.6730515]|uniref:S1C family serine protease n=1 Tax=Enterobacter cloacae complex sp.6730515 TaxID=3397171 RepID=UPI003AABE50F
IDRNLADAYKLPKPEGALITQVSPNSPAQKAGLRAGDVILKLNGASVLRTSDLLYALNKVQPNQTVQFEVLRDDKTRNFSATLATAPDETPATGNQASA